jgi:hypothetical protein
VAIPVASETQTEEMFPHGNYQYIYSTNICLKFWKLQSAGWINRSLSERAYLLFDRFTAG